MFSIILALNIISSTGENAETHEDGCPKHSTHPHTHTHTHTPTQPLFCPHSVTHRHTHTHTHRHTHRHTHTRTHARTHTNKHIQAHQGPLNFFSGRSAVKRVRVWWGVASPVAHYRLIYPSLLSLSPSSRPLILNSAVQHSSADYTEQLMSPTRGFNLKHQTARELYSYEES